MDTDNFDTVNFEFEHLFNDLPWNHKHPSGELYEMPLCSELVKASKVRKHVEELGENVSDLSDAEICNTQMVNEKRRNLHDIAFVHKGYKTI